MERMNYRQAYLKAFENECIELIVHAYDVATSEKKYQTNWLENDFSELLGYYVNESQLSLKKGITCKTENKLFIEKENQIKGYADKLPRIDFVLFKIWKKQRFHYYMEAKRLKEKDSDLKRAYIDEGMERFISKKYPIGCMLGYLLKGKTDETVKGINSLLQKDERGAEILISKNHKLSNAYFESNHVVIGTLKHLILDLTLLSN